MLPSPNMASELLCGGEDDVEEADDERGDEQSSDVDRLRLSVIVGVGVRKDVYHASGVMI